MRPTALVLLLTLLLNGCFTYVPAAAAPGRAARVRVILAAPADFRLTEYTANEVAVVEGELVRADDELVVVSALDLRARSGYEFAARGETLEIPRANVAALQSKKISPVRSGLLAGAVVLVMTVTGRALGLGGGNEGGGKGGPPTET